MNTTASCGPATPGQEPNTLHFSAPWGRTLRWLSILTTFACLAASATGLAFQLAPQVPLWARVLHIGMPLFILLGSAPFMIRGYTVTAETLLVHRLFWDTAIPLRGLIRADPHANVMHRSWRTCGNGGLYSFTGWYWNKPLGHYRAFVTDLTNTVVMRFAHRTVVISPETPDAFVAALSPRLRDAPP